MSGIPKGLRNAPSQTCQKQNTHNIKNNSSFKHSFGSLLTTAWHRAKAADIIPALRAPSAMCEDAFQTVNTVQGQRG